MSSFDFLIPLASAFAFVALFLFFISLSKAMAKEKRASSIASNQDKSQNAFIFASTLIFRGAALRLLEFRWVFQKAKEISALLELNGRKLKADEVVSSALLVFVIALVAGSVIGASLLFGICLGICVIAGLYVIMRRKIHAVSFDMRQQVPDALRCIESCSRSGLSLYQSLLEASRECKGGLASAFGSAANRMALGETVKESLQTLTVFSEVPELKFVSIALEVQHISGGAIAPVLESARESVICELDLARTLEVQTAQAKMSATIVTFMPFLLLALFSFASPGFLSPFFSSIAGLFVLLLALLMQAAGIYLVRKIFAKARD